MSETRPFIRYEPEQHPDPLVQAIANRLREIPAIKAEIEAMERDILEGAPD
jgi:hypothetical protein